MPIRLTGEPDVATLRGPCEPSARDYRPLVEAMIPQAEQACGIPMLRVHWYDSAKIGLPDPQQERIGEIPKVKLKLGPFGVDGQPKGVDLRIGLDLIAHARNGAADVFFLVSGDDDLTEAVEEAPVLGVEVVVLAVPSPEGKPHGVSRHLVRASDELQLLEPAAIDRTVMKVEVPKAEPVAPPPPAPAASTASVPTPRDLAAMTRPAPPSPAAVVAYSGSTGARSQVLPGYGEPDEHDRPGPRHSAVPDQQAVTVAEGRQHRAATDPGHPDHTPTFPSTATSGVMSEA